MTIEPGSVEHLSQLISHVVAPAFLLGAVGSFISLLSDRLLGVVQRIRDMGKTGDVEGGDEPAGKIAQRLRTRATLLNLAILFSVVSGIAALVLIIAAFAAALVSVHHVWLAALLFIISAFFLLCSLITFGIDVKMGLSGHDLH